MKMSATEKSTGGDVGSREIKKTFSHIIPPSATRVPAHTKRHVQERIRQTTVDNIARSIALPNTIDQRLEQLDREWDTERTLELNASILAMSGALLGRFVDRRWFLLTVGITGFLAQHAVQGWCPPLPILRRLGVRTRREIEQERGALKMIRGDTGSLSEHQDTYHQAEELLRIQEY